MPERQAAADAAAVAGAAPDAAAVRAALAEILDPEYPVSIVDLGLIRGVDVAGSTVRVRMTYTSMGCPCMEMIQDDVRARVRALPGVERVEIEVTWEPWTREHISENGLKQLRGVGVV
jgi:metal-sulfur cluster biosynthetic enzyme